MPSKSKMTAMGRGTRTILTADNVTVRRAGPKGPGLLSSQRDHRIDARGSTRGDIAREHRDEREERGGADEADRVRGADVVELTRDHARDGGGAGEAAQDPETGEPGSL